VAEHTTFDTWAVASGPFPKAVFVHQRKLSLEVRSGQFQQ
jgi:hypothetical protein